MCEMIESCGQSLVCLCQMIIRILMTSVLMVENLLRLIMQTVYNLLSFVTQLISLIPICCVFILTTKLKGLIFCSGGGGTIGGQKASTCDCFVSTIMLICIFFVFRETGVLDRIMVKIGYIPTKGLREKLVKSKVEFPKGWTIPRDWKSLRRRQNETGLRLLSASEEYEDSTCSFTTESSFSTPNWTTVFYYIAR